MIGFVHGFVMWRDVRRIATSFNMPSVHCRTAAKEEPTTQPLLSFSTFSSLDSPTSLDWRSWWRTTEVRKARSSALYNRDFSALLREERI